VDENSDEWIFGYPLSVQKHLEDQKKYGAHTEENKKTLEDMKKKNELMEELLENVEQHGLLTHKVANKVKEIRKTEIFKDDPEFQKIINILAANGFFTV
jgi:CO dehydrogenase/acetyl-CoA synthase alpha subunit